MKDAMLFQASILALEVAFHSLKRELGEKWLSVEEFFRGPGSSSKR